MTQPLVSDEDVGKQDTAPPAESPPEDTKATAAPRPLGSTSVPRKALLLLVLGLVGVSGSIAAGLHLANRARSPEVVASRAWRGRVVQVVRSGAEKTGGLTLSTGGAPGPIDVGAEVRAGGDLVTDPRSRARVELDDGSILVLDRGTTVAFGESARTLTVKDGVILLEVAHVEGAPNGRVSTRGGEVEITGTKLQVAATEDRTSVEVLRGEVRVTTPQRSEEVKAGQEAILSAGSIEVLPANDLAQRSAFGETASRHNEDTDPSVSGLGELRARRPGKADEKDRAVRLSKHDVKIRIVGGVARTEIEETFQNDTDDELEGIYRFPLPSTASIERLALDVDGKLVEGEFVDRSKASAIWRGAIQNAAPKAARPREEIIWVPGPWHDPALLEWQRGGRFELRIFPIPKHGSRRVVLAYTETVALSGDVRRYTYPLPHATSSKLVVDSFHVDAQILGRDPTRPARARGYELSHEVGAEKESDRFSHTFTSFTPSGDLTLEYTPRNARADAVAWAYTDTRDRPDRADKAKAVSPEKESFVAIALRPKLPRWADTRPRDHVLVVDSGRAMFGERFLRARRLAVQTIHEMDRRDRVTVLACDIGCRALPQGFSFGGAAAAHDAEAFLSGITPDGASDLVGAVDAAGHVAGHEKARDLRVVLLSDGVASAGYRTPARVAREVRAVLGEATTTVTAVPIGADADTHLLGEIARGGGGVTVSYQPGEGLEATALQVLNATYGTALRDVEVVLPDGLTDVAPATLAPIRPGSETFVTARMKGDRVHGDVVLRGKVGGDPFEVKYPIDVRSGDDPGNAFVPRLFAARRIADRERENLSDGPAKAELVSLSRRYAVPSRFTSLLVLESEGMFKAFGIDRADRAVSWTGESGGKALDVTVADPSAALGADVSGFGGGGGLGALGASLGSKDDGFADKKPMAKAAAEADERRSSAAPLATGTAAATMGPAATTPPPARRAPAPDWNGGRRRGGQFMKKIFVRHAQIAQDATPIVADDKLAAARAALVAAPDERGKHKELVRLLALSGRLDELDDTLSKWSARDPMDADLLSMRADLLARRGDRDGALKMLSGALSSPSMSAQDAFLWSSQVALAFERAGRSEACAFRVAAAESRHEDVDAVARAVHCERARGRAFAADVWLAGLKNAAQVQAAVAKLGSAENASFGDVIVRATWEGGADLDVVVVDPSGNRASWSGRQRGVRVQDPTARDHETLAISNGAAGTFAVELVRAGKGGQPASGKVLIQAAGEQATVPFVLSGDRVQVARVAVRYDQELVPLRDDEAVEERQLPPFDRAAAVRAVSRVSVSQCARPDGPSGNGSVNVTFAGNGFVQNASLGAGPFAGSGVGACVLSMFRRVSIPAFQGPPVTVGKSFSVPADASTSPF